ncbi:glycoside hydrolase family 15 protein [Tanticharoenia sakaeratensis]|uniref:Glycoside hydrolase 15-related n=1 Tax=Tanticharoenia sakaeratensis NBRC 103193 TaxID=1231623 RepID=A0A0D6MIJ0_9PROT|nr:glycoside hydrolase family 15 protein [Tanticharoenia sakaeratensis]GAN53301.1 glycoside hydrolase 15-related [Tanticharoenia sakaeratensis NBRC 103193]GBQ21037.1 glycoside hydrolase 15-related protein [Tanticharoenia sakaeratensis NBRC 103193]
MSETRNLSSPPFMPIENHAVIGDLRTTALIALDGAVDMMCWPRFDSPSIFARLLDDDGGVFELAPTLDGGRHTQFYVPDTNILLTRTLSHEGVSEISDFMPLGPENQIQRLVRRIKSVRGEIACTMRCAPRFDYARARHTVRRIDDQVVLFLPEGARLPTLRLCASVPILIENGDGVARFTLGVNESAIFTLDAELEGANPCSDVPLLSESFKSTANFWREWVARSPYRGRWHDPITRSLLVLKLLTSAEFGSMVAAATFGLPETVGGERNWDYRYTWVRDSSFMIYAFMQTGHRAEATDFIRWMHARRGEAFENEGLRVLYGIDGRRISTETDLTHFKGYLGSKPVRIGNAAEDQLQLDIYGELLDAVYMADRFCERLSYEDWMSVTVGMDWLCDHWNQPDEGIWEVRGGRRHFLHSRVMCWVAFDRAIRLAQERGLPGHIALWTRERNAIYNDVHKNFWNEERQFFGQSIGSDTIDASCLLMPLVGFIGDGDPRWRSTLRAVGELLLDDSHVYRYRARDGVNEDGLNGIEGTFTMCSFWYIECLARSGDLLQARFLFEKMLAYANHVGLFAEELGPAGEHLGNFPQAFTHLALIRAGQYLDRALTSQMGAV